VVRTMDERSRNAVAFLGALGREWRRLSTEVKGHYGHGAGRLAGFPVLGLTSKGLTLTLPIKGSDRLEYDVEVEVTWDAERWIIMTGIYRDADKGGQETLQLLPERQASDLDGCIEQVHAAISDLEKFAHLVP